MKIKIQHNDPLVNIWCGIAFGPLAAKRWKRHSPEWLGVNSQVGDS